MSRVSGHIERVMEVTQSASAGARSRLAASWYRSRARHGLDPAEHRAPERLEGKALDARRQDHEKFLMVATPRLDRLFSLVGQSGCAVLLTDSEGVVLDQRVNESDADVFASWGLWSGANWSEARRVFGLDATGALAPRPAADIFSRGDGPSGFEKAERAAVIRALARADGNVSQAARQLGMGRATLYRRMKRLGLDDI